MVCSEIRRRAPVRDSRSTFNHTWPWPPWVTLLFLIAAAAYVVAVYLREPGTVRRRTRLALATVRILLIALLLTMMYGWMLERYRTDLPDIVVVVDDSQSMGVVDQYDEPRLTDKLERQQLQALQLREAEPHQPGQGAAAGAGRRLAHESPGALQRQVVPAQHHRADPERTGGAAARRAAVDGSDANRRVGWVTGCRTSSSRSAVVRRRLSCC